jgi:streptogramin lyase
MQRRVFLSSSFAFASASLLPAKEVPVRKPRVETVFKSPGPKPNGLQATAEGLWILDQGDNRAYLVKYEGGALVRKLDTDCKAGSGITHDGEALWLASTYSREILRIDPQSGKTLKKFPSPGAGPVAWSAGRQSPLAPPPKAQQANTAPSNPAPRASTGAHGLEWKDGKLYISNPPSQKVYRVNPETWAVEREWKTAGDRPHGLGWEGKYLWCVDSNLNAFFRHDPETGEVSARIQLADSDPLPHGMTIWRGYMWYCDDVGVVCRFKM